MSLLWERRRGTNVAGFRRESTRRSVFSCQCFLGLQQFLNTLLNLVSRCSKLFDWLAVWVVNKPVLEQLSRRPSFWKIHSTTTKRNHYIEVRGLKIRERLGSLARNINSSFPHYFDCSWVNGAGFKAGAYDFERPGSQASSKAFSHLGPARIPFTCE